MRRLLRLLGRNTPARPALVERKPLEEDLDTMLDQLVSGDDASKDDRVQDGMLSLHEGHIRVTAPSRRGRHPVIRPGNHTRVFVNDREVQRMQVITPDDDVRVEVVDEAPQTSLRAHVSKDRLMAHLTVFAKHGTRYRLLDHEGEDVTINAVPEVMVAPSPPTIEELQTA